ncbi:MAG: hypothetical protein RJB25_264 [Bacteroidota bacterium]|jgi:hypothetical protein
MKNSFFGFLFLLLAFTGKAQSTLKDVHSLDQIIDNWHIAAAQAKFEPYFSVTSADFVFLGTAPGERWTKPEFMAFCKPYFEKGKAWDFKPSHRHWQFAANGTVAYFDEDLATWMEGCRGSGICVLQNGEWKIAYYNLTVLIENEKIKPFIKLRKQ